MLIIKQCYRRDSRSKSGQKKNCATTEKRSLLFRLCSLQWGSSKLQARCKTQDNKNICEKGPSTSVEEVGKVELAALWLPWSFLFPEGGHENKKWLPRLKSSQENWEGFEDFLTKLQPLPSHSVTGVHYLQCWITDPITNQRWQRPTEEQSYATKNNQSLDKKAIWITFLWYSKSLGCKEEE